MNARRISLILFVALTISSLLLSACQPQAGAPATPTGAAATAAVEPTKAGGLGGRTVRVGSDTTYPPFESVDASGKIVGFDPDLMAWIAQDQGFQAEFVTTAWDGIFPALAAGDFDAVMSAVTITEERKQIIDFTDPYFQVGQVVSVRADESAIQSYQDLGGKTVGVQIGTTGETAALEVAQVPESNLKRFDTIDVAFQALLSGDLDAVVADAPTSNNYVNANAGQLKVTGGEGEAAWFTTEDYGIAVQKGNTELLNALNAGIANAKAAGIIEDLARTWAIGEFAEPEAEPTPGGTAGAVDCAYGGEFQSIEAVDDMTVKFTLCYPDPAFLSKIAFSAFAIHPSEVLESTGGGGDLLRSPVGTGPYTIDEWVAGDHITFQANPDYWGDPAVAQTLVFRWNSEASNRLLELQAGTADGIDNPSPNDFATIEGDANLALYPRPPLNIFYLGLNNTIPPFDNEQVRQAVYMAIDKQTIVDQYYPEGSLVATQFNPPALLPGYSEGLEDYPFDPEAARQMLADAGFADGFEVDLSYRDVVRGYLPQATKVAEELQTQLAEVGITVNINVMESGTFLDAASNGEVAMFMLGWGADYPDATNFLDFHFGKGANASFGDLWPEITDRLAEAGSIADPDERQALYDEVNELIKEHVPMIPIAHGASATAFLADVEGAHASPLGNESMAVMTPGDRDQLVWMQNAEPLSLYCADETDGETLRACEQVNESLMAYEVGGVEVIPSLATECTPNENATEWTCTLREGVTFHDGSTLDAQDVLLSFMVQWDASHPLHVGNTGNFDYFTGFFGAFANTEAEPQPTP